jgi:hypothetical protein
MDGVESTFDAFDGGWKMHIRAADLKHGAVLRTAVRIGILRGRNASAQQDRQLDGEALWGLRGG